MFLYIFPIICACIIVATSFGSRQILPLTIDGITNDRALDYITLSFAFAVGQVIWGFANYIGGMISEGTPKLDELNDLIDYKLIVKHTIWDSLISVFSFGLYTPTTIIILR